MPDPSKEIIKAAKAGDVVRIKELLAIESRALINSRDKDGPTPLHCATWKGQTEVVALLIEAGADVNGRGRQSQITPRLLANACSTLPPPKEEPMNLRMLCISMLVLLTLGQAARVSGTRILLVNHGLEARTTTGVIAEVERLGGKVELDETLPGKPIVKIDLHGTQVTDSDLAFLNDAKKELKELRYLDLRLTHIGDAGAANLKHLTSLTTLNLFRTQVGDKGLSYLKKLTKLETLLIGGTKVTDSGLANLRSMKELKKLSLFQTQVTDAGVPYLKVLSKLEQLLISGTKITDAGARELLKALPRLRFSENT